MKKFLPFILILIVIITTGFGCQNSTPSSTSSPQATKEIPHIDDGTYRLVPRPTQSLTWRAKKIPDTEHHGAFPKINGSALVENGVVTQADLRIGMSTVTVLDLEGEEKEKMETHLKSADFFDAETYPLATFVWKQTDNNIVTGDLTIKNITKEIQLPVNVTTRNQEFTIKGNTVINRTDWDIRYGSGKFFKGLGDNVIKDEVEIGFNMTFRVPGKRAEPLTVPASQ